MMKIEEEEEEEECKELSLWLADKQQPWKRQKSKAKDAACGERKIIQKGIFKLIFATLGSGTFRDNS